MDEIAVQIERVSLADIRRLGGKLVSHVPKAQAFLGPKAMRI
jgi:hypothetical protein